MCEFVPHKHIIQTAHGCTVETGPRTVDQNHPGWCVKLRSATKLVMYVLFYMDGKHQPHMHSSVRMESINTPYTTAVASEGGGVKQV